MNLKHARLLIFSAIVFTALLSSCRKTDTETAPSKNKTINTFIHNYLRTEKWYLWYDQAPEVAPDDRDPNEYLNALLYTEKDKWSFVIDTVTYNSLITGTYYGYGFAYRWHIDNTLRVSLVFDNSPMAIAGIKRGYEIMEINGKRVSYIQNNGLWNTILGEDKLGVSNTFKFKDTNGNIFTKTLAKASVTQNTVFNTKIFNNVNGTNVGYLYFHSFMNESGEAELKTAFNNFQANNVTRLVIDLRYNGGGSLLTAVDFGGLIKGADRAGNRFLNLKHNSYHTSTDAYANLAQLAQSLRNVDKVVFITTPSTASASEIMINCLKPYMDVKVVGDVTDGKPVGMEAAEDKTTGMLLVAITFKTVNSLGVGDYFSGITPDAYCYDGLDKEFGDENENCLKQALYYLKNSSFDNSILSKKSSVVTPAQPEFRGVKRLISAF